MLCQVLLLLNRQIKVKYGMSKICQLFSGSSGNAIYVQCRNAKFLIDAGVSAKRLDTALGNIGVNPDELDAIFVTHEHIDHIKGVRVFAARHKTPVFANESVLEKMIANGSINEKVTAEKTSENMLLCSAEIIPFRLSHDSAACYGYRFNLPDGRSVSICTDTGCITDEARVVIQGTDLIFLESNHEITMLQNGFYPYSLKQRILSDRGHLSNRDCAQYAKELVKTGTTRLILAHLSKENNHPDIARQTTLCALEQDGLQENADFRLKVSAPENSERPIIL